MEEGDLVPDSEEEEGEVGEEKEAAVGGDDSGNDRAPCVATCKQCSE